jgi:hypothetical protein
MFQAFRLLTRGTARIPTQKGNYSGKYGNKNYYKGTGDAKVGHHTRRGMFGLACGNARSLELTVV